MRRQCCCALKIGLAILLIGSLAVRPGFAKGARGGQHADDGKAAARPAETGAGQAPSAEDKGGGAAKADTTLHAPARNDTDRRSGPASPEPDASNKDAPRGKPGDIDTRITVQPRRLGKSAKPNNGHAKTIESPIARNLYHRRTLSSVPRAPNPPVRNAIGLPVSPRGNVGPRGGMPVRNAIGLPVSPRGDVGPRDGMHPNSLAVPPSAVPAVVPGSATGRLTGVGGGLDRRVPNAYPSITSPAAGRGAINGTGLAHRNLGPPQIGGPKTSVAGLNGTMIKPKH
jgi:hypothetical protein